MISPLLASKDCQSPCHISVPELARQSTREDLERRRELHHHLSTANYDYLQHSRAAAIAAPPTEPSVALQALCGMFPSVEREAIAEVLASCQEDAQRAAELLLQT